MIRLRFGLALVVAIGIIPATISAQAGDDTRRFQATGVVIAADAATRQIVIAHDAIPGLMGAMTMPFTVPKASDLVNVATGAFVEFTLVVGRDSSHVEGITIRRYQGVEQDPLTARRLALLTQLTKGSSTPALAAGDAVPDFTLVDQDGRRVTLSAFTGKVVAVNFMYTTCQLPDFCLRIVNHFAVLQKRFAGRLGRDLILLTITFDPARDTPDVLKAYAAQWKPDLRYWRFLTGSPADIRPVLDRFGLVAFPNDGLMDHTLRTVLINRQGRVAASLEGNQYSTDQLISLTTHVLDAR